MKLIGLTGAIGSGKSTVAEILCQNHGYKELVFKNSMAESLAFIFRVSTLVFTDRELKEKPLPELMGKSPRELMQSFGTDWGRKLVHPDIWVKCTEKVIETASLPNVVISDVRFENEAKMIKRLGGVIWKIERSDNPYKVESSHESEQGLHFSNINSIIENNCSLEDLNTLIELTLANSILPRPKDYDLVPCYYGA